MNELLEKKTTREWGGETDDIAKEPTKPWRYMKELLKRSTSKLLVISSVWPFDLFPNKIIIDENKVDLFYHDFFWMTRTYSVFLENIKTVRVGVGPLFASITMEVAGFEANPEPISFLRKVDAIQAKRMILGLMACAKEHIDFTNHPVGEVRQIVEEIGKSGELVGSTYSLT